MSATIRDSLKASLIRASMAPETRARLSELTLLQQTDSTNTAILRMPPERQHAHALLADRQTAGRGRRQRTWHSPPGGNIYLSLGWRFRKAGIPLSNLPLVVAVTVCRALDRAGLRGHGIKWPNDILFEGKKLAGILVESRSASSEPALAVIGIGLNVRMPPSDAHAGTSGIDRPWTDLGSALGPEIDLKSRNQLVALLLEALLDALEDFEQNGFDRFRPAWRDFDILAGQKIILEQDNGRIEGVARGVDRDGGLLVEIAESDVRAFHSADVSVHYD